MSTAKKSDPKLWETVKSDLYEKAKEAGVNGRSTMSKQELVDALKD